MILTNFSHAYNVEQLALEILTKQRIILKNEYPAANKLGGTSRQTTVELALSRFPRAALDLSTRALSGEIYAPYSS